MTDKAGLLQYWFLPCVFLRLKIFFLLNSFNFSYCSCILRTCTLALVVDIRQMDPSPDGSLPTAEY